MAEPRPKLTMSRILILIAFPLTLTSASVAAGTFKWVDEKGITHYGDSLPVQYKDKGSVELNKRGMVIKKNQPALTPEQIKQRDDDIAKQKLEEQHKAEQRRIDSALLNTYTTETEIDLRRDRELRHSEAALHTVKLNLELAQVKLDELSKRAAILASNRKPVPIELTEEIARAKAEKEHNENLTALKLQEMDTLRAQYEAYKKRYVELRAVNDGSATK